MQKRFDVVQDPRGNAVEGATVEILIYPGGGIPTIYSDDGVAAITGAVLTTDEDGYFEYYAPNGHYTWRITTNAGVKTIPDVIHDDSLSSNQQFVVATGTGDALVVAAFVAGYTLADGDLVRVRAPGRNSVVAPTVTFPGVGVTTITRRGGKALQIGDIVGSGHELLLQYRATPKRAELLNYDTRLNVNVSDYGAVGDGVTDDTVAFQNAVSSGKNVVGRPGDTYLVDGGANASATGQVINFAGCTIKLKNAAVTKGILTLSGARTKVTGGTWDMNKANNGTGSEYGHFAALLTGDGSVADDLYVKDSYGIGIKGANNVNYATISRNRIEGCRLHGIYVEAVTASAEGNKIVDNYIDGTLMVDGATGLYLTALHTSGFYQRRWNVSRNFVKAPADVTGITVVGITIRGIDGVYAGNQVTGGMLQHSLDITSRSTIVGNRGTDPATGAAATYGLEINGGWNTISGNYFKGSTRGIVGTGNTLDNNAISGNVLEDITETGMYFAPGGVLTGKNADITGNLITFTVGVARVGIRLVGNMAGAHISGNTIVGPGSGQANCRAVYVDTPPAAAFVSVVANRVSGFERAFAAYSAAVLTVTDLSSIANDLSNDVGQSGNGWIVEGAAVIGARVSNLWPQSSVGALQSIMDRQADVQHFLSTATNNPEGSIAAGIGSIFISLNTGGSWIKRSGTGTTGWGDLGPHLVGGDQGDAAAVYTPGVTIKTLRWATPITADRAVTLTAANAINGERVRVVRQASATGAFNLNVGTGPLKALAVGQWCDVEYNGAAWMLTAFGAL